jgi:hypothetical protein
MPTKNLRHGRIRLFSGDVPLALEKTAAFTEGDFSFTRAKTTIQVKDRGALGHLRRGDEEAVAWSFSAKFIDKTLRETAEDYVWEGTTFQIKALTPSSNQVAAVPYRYRQGSMQPATGEAIATKLAAGVAPSSDNEFSEPVGLLRQEAEFLEIDPGTLNVYPAAADTDMDVVFDAIGTSTLDPKGTTAPRCESDKRTFLIILEKFDVALTKEGVIAEQYEINHATIESVEQAEGDEFDTLTFSGIGYVTKPSVSPGGPSDIVSPPTEQTIELNLSDSVFVSDELDDLDVLITQ